MITKLIILICVGIYLYIRFVLKDISVHSAVKMGALIPRKVTDEHQYYRILTANFVHIDIFHLIINMYCIYNLGSFLEFMLGYYYIGLVFASMLMCGVIAYATSFYFPHLEHTVTLGASGIFFGYLGAIIGLALFNGGVYMNILQSSMYMIIINIAFTIFMPGISKAGHIGGLIGGYLYSFILSQLLK